MPFFKDRRIFLKRQRQKEESDGVYMGESGGVVQRRDRRFVSPKNTAFFARPTKNARKRKNNKTADKREDVISEQGDNSAGWTVQHPAFFFFKGRKGEFLFFLFKRNLNFFFYENRGKWRIALVFGKNELEADSVYFRKFFCQNVLSH